MITLPDFNNKQILFIQTERGVENKIKIQNDHIVFTKNGEIMNRASCHRVFVVFIIGDISITSELIKKGKQLGVSFFLLKHNFDCYATIGAAAEGNYLLRMRQYEMNQEKELAISRSIITQKIDNQLRLLRSRKLSPKLVARRDDIIATVESVDNQDSLRGIEGNISKEFFQAYFEPMDWWKRLPRVKPDIPNFLLDIGYTYMFNFVDSLLRLYGFDTYKGCYHKLFFQRRSLTCDMVEPFRCIVDREVLKMHTLGKINPDDFVIAQQKVTLPFQHNSKYTQPFMQAIIKQREPIYNFVQGYYRFVMNSERNNFPKFTVSR